MWELELVQTSLHHIKVCHFFFYTFIEKIKVVYFNHVVSSLNFSPVLPTFLPTQLSVPKFLILQKATEPGGPARVKATQRAWLWSLHVHPSLPTHTAAWGNNLKARIVDGSSIFQKIFSFLEATLSLNILEASQNVNIFSKYWGSILFSRDVYGSFWFQILPCSVRINSVL